MQGGMKIRSYADDLPFYKKVYDAKGREYSLRVSKKDSSIIFLSEITDRTSADVLRGQIFYVNRNDLKPVGKNQFYICDLLGKKITVEGSEIHCEIVSFQNYGAGDLVELSFKKKTFLVPFTKQNFPNSNFIISKKAFEGFIENVAG